MTEHWDYVIVGGGSAGCVVAARLSEDPSARVLLLEAGKDWRSAEAPAVVRRVELATNLMRRSKKYGIWQWTQIAARRTSQQQPRPYLQGAGLGGCSVINGMVALRPPLSDFDRWVELGCVGWSAEEVLDSFVRLEDDKAFGEAAYHGHGGPVPIERLERKDWSRLDSAFVESALGLGYRWCGDLNAPHSSGVGPFPGNVHSGGRVTANDSYVEPARERPNLEVRGNCLVDRVLFNDHCNVVGVSCVVERKPVPIAAGQVILCAGSIQTAAILMRSGVGPAADLRQLDIEVLVDAPVGRRLQDHPMFALSIQGDSLRDSATGRGYSVALRTSSEFEGGAENDILIHPCFNHSDTSRTVALFVFLYHCHSRGELRLVSRDPGVAPTIEERLLSSENDLARMRIAVRRSIELIRSRELQKIGGQAVIGRDACLLSSADRDETLDSLLLAESTDAKHLSCTCPMGNPDDPGVVVDPSGQVLGVSGLRVADMSLTPFVPRANTYLTALMIGEHVSSMIRSGRQSEVVP